MLTANEFPTGRVVEFSPLFLAFNAANAAGVVRPLSASDTQASGFQAGIALLFASGVACSNVRGCYLRILSVSVAVGLKVALAKELAIVEFHCLNAAKAVSKSHKATATFGCNFSILLSIHG